MSTYQSLSESTAMVTATTSSWRTMYDEFKASYVDFCVAGSVKSRELCHSLPDCIVTQSFEEEQSLSETIAKIVSLAILDPTTTKHEQSGLNATMKLVYYYNQLSCIYRLYTQCTDSYTYADKSTPESGEPEPADKESLALGLSRFTMLDDEKTNSFQRLLLYVLSNLQSKGYRNYSGVCYELRYVTINDRFVSTCSWKRVCTVSDFVYMVTRKEVNFDMWKALTSMKTNLSSVIEYLTSARDVQFPTITKNRYVLSFRNGIYLVDRDEFVPYADERISRVSESTSAAKFFDADFDDSPVEGGDWYGGIDTRHFQSILDSQQMSKSVCRWFYVLVGRLLYDLNYKDSWQIIVYLLGMPGSGKSTVLLFVVGKFYEAEDVGVISNNIERKFGLSEVANKFVVISPEVTNNMVLEQAEFQSMVAGENMQLAVKYGCPMTVRWKTPGIMAGNELPAWALKPGASRRLAVIKYNVAVKNTDTNLNVKLETELPRIIRKCNKAYLEAVEMCGSDNIWNHLPNEFRTALQEVAEHRDPLISFLSCDDIEFDESIYMPYNRFLEMYKLFCSNAGFKYSRPSNIDHVKCLLQQKNCSLETNTLKYPPNQYGVVYKGVFIKGLDHNMSGQ